MSETQTAAPETAPPPYVATNIETSDPALLPQAEPEEKTPAEEPKQEPEPEKKADPDPPEPEETPEQRKSRDDRRWANITAQRRAAEARADAAERELALARAQQPAADAPKQTQAEIDALVDARIVQREIETKRHAWINAGNAEYGAASFDERCAAVSSVATREQAGMLMNAVADMPDGAKIVGLLAEDLQEATRILAIRNPFLMGAELADFGRKSAKPAAQPASATRAPPPVRSPGGRASPEPSADGQSYDDYLKWSAKALRTR